MRPLLWLLQRVGWLVRGERPLRGVRGLITGQRARQRGKSALYTVTRVTEAGTTWGRPSGGHETGAAAYEVAQDELARRPNFTPDDESTVIALLMRRCGVGEETAMHTVAAALRARGQRDA